MILWVMLVFWERPIQNCRTEPLWSEKEVLSLSCRRGVQAHRINHRGSVRPPLPVTGVLVLRRESPVMAANSWCNSDQMSKQLPHALDSGVIQGMKHTASWAVTHKRCVCESSVVHSPIQNRVTSKHSKITIILHTSPLSLTIQVCHNSHYFLLITKTPFYDTTSLGIYFIY